MEFEKYLSESPVFQVYKVEQALSQRLNPLLGKLGVNFVQSLILLTLLFEKEETVRPSDLSKVLGTSKATISHHISTLETNKYVQRKVFEGDARVLSLVLTTSGKTKANQLIKLFGQFDSLIEDKLGKKVSTKLAYSLCQMSTTT